MLYYGVWNAGNLEGVEMRYQLLNKDKVVAVFEERGAYGEYVYDMVEQHDNYLPTGLPTLTIGLTTGKSPNIARP